MFTAIFVITTVICGCGWLSSHISVLSLLWYLQEKNVPFPSGEEMKTGTNWAASHFFKDLFARKGKH